MSYPINYPTPQNADVQIFSVGGSTSDWVKPQGCSFVFFTLIGAGGDGAGGTTSAGGGGGGGGVITVCLVPAFLIPDVLSVFVGKGGAGSGGANRTVVEYRLKSTSSFLLLAATSSANASGSTGQSGGSAFTSNYFSAMGFVNSISGQGGSNAGSNVTASTVLSGGAGGGASLNTTGGSVTPFLGYPTISGGAPAPAQNGNNGISIFSNLLLSCGGSGGAGGRTLPSEAGGNGGNGGIGSGGGGGGICGSGTSEGGKGGDGLVVIVSW